MLNIFSIEEKKKILIEYRLRLAVVSIFAVGALVLASLILLAPPYFLAISKHNDADRELAALEEKGGAREQEKEINIQIRDINNKISLLANGAEGRLSPPQIILDIIEIKGDTIKIEQFAYDVNLAQERITLSGTALDRSSLALFIEALKMNPLFTDVSLPISSYVKSSDINFTAAIEIKAKTPAQK